MKYLKKALLRALLGIRSFTHAILFFCKHYFKMCGISVLYTCRETNGQFLFACCLHWPLKNLSHFREFTVMRINPAFFSSSSCVPLCDPIIGNNKNLICPADRGKAVCDRIGAVLCQFFEAFLNPSFALIIQCTCCLI